MKIDKNNNDNILHSYFLECYKHNFSRLLAIQPLILITSGYSTFCLSGPSATRHLTSRLLVSQHSVCRPLGYSVSSHLELGQLS